MLARLLPKILISLVLGGGFAWLASQGGVPLLPPLEDFAKLELSALAGYIGLYGLSHLMRAMRWRHLIAPTRPMPLRDVIPLNWVGFFAIFAFPLRLGEFARPLVGKARFQIPVTLGLGTVAVERVVDGLITSSAVIWALNALPRQQTDDPIAQALPYYAGLAVTVFISAFALLLLFLASRRLARRLLETVFGLISPKLGQTVADKVEKLADGLRCLGNPKLAAAFITESLLYFGLQIIAIYVLARGVHIDFSLGQSTALLGIVALGILLPAGPGLFGNFQLAVVATLHLYASPAVIEGQGALFTFLLYVCQAAIILVAGIVPLYVLKIPLSGLIQRPSKASEESAHGTATEQS